MVDEVENFQKTEGYYGKMMTGLKRVHSQMGCTFSPLPQEGQMTECAKRVALLIVAPFAYLALALGYVAGLTLTTGVAFKDLFFKRDVVIIGAGPMEKLNAWKQLDLRVMLRYKAFYEVNKEIDYKKLAEQKVRVIIVYTPTNQSDANGVTEHSPLTLARKKCDKFKIPWCMFIRYTDDAWLSKATNGWKKLPRCILGNNSMLPFTKNSTILTQFFKSPV